jgi:hypothetical protein
MVALSQYLSKQGAAYKRAKAGTQKMRYLFFVAQPVN